MKKLIEAIINGEIYQPAYSTSVKVTKHPLFPWLIILNYLDDCRKWDEVTYWARGFIFDTQTNQAVAVPLPKFWHVGHPCGVKLENLPRGRFMAFEKVDGEFGISFYLPNGEIAMATKGSFDSPQAVKGTELLKKLEGASLIPDNLNFIFEIVATETYSVVKYENEELVLLAGVDRETGQELPWEKIESWAIILGCRTAKTYEFANIEELIQARKCLTSAMEGWVILFPNGLRVKIKGLGYLQEKARAKKLEIDWLDGVRKTGYA